MPNKVCDFIRENFKQDAEILDINCGVGAWKNLLPEYTNIDGVDGWELNCIRCRDTYRRTFHKDAVRFEYDHYDLVIINTEYMEEKELQKILQYALERCTDVIVDKAVKGLEQVDGCFYHKKQPKRSVKTGEKRTKNV